MKKTSKQTTRHQISRNKQPKQKAEKTSQKQKQKNEKKNINIIKNKKTKDN